MKKDLYQPEASADQAAVSAVSENLTELSWLGIGADVKIFRGFSKVKVSNPTTDQVGNIAGIPQAVQYLQRFPVNIFSRYG
jgi:hypothetical protein